MKYYNNIKNFFKKRKLYSKIKKVEKEYLTGKIPSTLHEMLITMFLIQISILNDNNRQ